MRKILIFLLTFQPLTAAAVSCADLSLKLEITALYPYPKTEESEWVEIKNNDGLAIDLSNYTLEDSTAKPWAMSGEISAGESLKIDSFPFQLNNGGDTVVLKTVTGTAVDTLAYASSKESEIIYKNAGLVLAAESDPITPSKLPLILEFIPNPEGSDSTSEWIELYNPHAETIDLTGLYLDDAEGGSTPYKLSTTLDTESYLLVSIEDSKISLNNSSDSVRLLGANKEVLIQVDYTGGAEGESYALINGEYLWTKSPTPASDNIISETATSEASFVNGDLSESVDISEIFPNPEGSDQDKEWIELTNGGGTDVNLGNWILDDGPDGSKPYIFPDGTVIKAGETIIIERGESGIALNNSNESLELKDYTGEVMAGIDYENSVEGESYSKIEVEEMQSDQASLSGLANKISDIWTWTEPSPGEKNPVWMQFKGEVTDFSDGLLTIFDGISKWSFKTRNQQLDNLVFGVGNKILLRAVKNGEIYEVTYSELIESAVSESEKTLPWLPVSGLLLGAIYLAYKFKTKELAF